MRKFVRVLGVFIVILILLTGVFFSVSYFRKKGAGISIETNPASTVWIDGVEVGRTPYESVRDPGEVVVKLLPDSFEKPLAPYETKVNITPDVRTVVTWEFGETEDLSSGSIVTFEKVGNSETSIAVISSPESAEVSLDGSVRGFTPFKTSQISQKDYDLSVKAVGYKDLNLQIKPQEGYKLTVVAKLIPSEVLAQLDPSPSPQPEVKEVEILDTGTGFLRVREGPTTSDKEVGRVEPKKKFPLIKEDEDSGWFKIEFDEGKEGWVSNQFARLVQEDS